CLLTPVVPLAAGIDSSSTLLPLLYITLAPSSSQASKSLSLSLCNLLNMVMSMDMFSSSRQPLSPLPPFNPRRSLDGPSHSRSHISSTEHLPALLSVIFLPLSMPLLSASHRQAFHHQASRQQASFVCRIETIRSEPHSIVNLLRSSSDPLSSTLPHLSPLTSWF
ncbi:unnamed protein product, partial [Brassica oleracea var. botrytis]